MTSDKGAAAKVKPLGLILAIARDGRFTHAEARFLASAVGHTDNGTRKHKNTLEKTAAEAGVGKNVPATAVNKAAEFGYIDRVLRYRNENGNQMVDVWFTANLASVSIATPGFRERATPGNRERVKPIPKPLPGPIPETGSTSATSTPSTTSTPSASQRRRLTKASDLASSREAISGEIEMCDLHVSYPKDACSECSRVAGLPLPKLSPLARRQQWERQVEGEGIDATSGTPIEDKPAVGYRGRSK